MLLISGSFLKSIYMKGESSVFPPPKTWMINGGMNWTGEGWREIMGRDGRLLLLSVVVFFFEIWFRGCERRWCLWLWCQPLVDTVTLPRDVVWEREMIYDVLTDERDERWDKSWCYQCRFRDFLISQSAKCRKCRACSAFQDSLFSIYWSLKQCQHLTTLTPKTRPPRLSVFPGLQFSPPLIDLIHPIQIQSQASTMIHRRRLRPLAMVGRLRTCHRSDLILDLSLIDLIFQIDEDWLLFGDGVIGAGISGQAHRA